MPNLIDIAQRLAEQPAVALLHEERCLPERDLGSTCARCAEACPVSAVTVGAVRDDAAAPTAAYGSVTKNGSAGPRIDDETCVRCGRCVTACPTAALVAVAPLDDDALLGASAQAGVAVAAAAHAQRAATADPEPANATQGSEPPPATAGFTCERAARTGRIDAERTVSLPCLAWVDEALVVHMACAGAQHIALLTAPCASCEQSAAVTALPQTVREAQRILDTWQIDAIVSITDTADGMFAPDDEDAVGEVSRRDLFSQAPPSRWHGQSPGVGFRWHRSRGRGCRWWWERPGTAGADAVADHEDLRDLVDQHHRGESEHTESSERDQEGD